MYFPIFTYFCCMKQLPKVFIGAPTYQGKHYALSRYAEAIRGQRYPAHRLRWLVVDNSPPAQKADSMRRIRAAGLEVRYQDPTGLTNPQTLALSHQRVADEALRWGADYLWHVESDLFPAPDVLPRMVATAEAYRLPVVSAAYHWGTGEHRSILVSGYAIISPGNLHQRVFSNAEVLALLAQGGLVQVSAMGLGCTLIRADVLADTPFRFVKGEKVHPDSYFNQDLVLKGIPNIWDTRIPATPHQNENWDHKPENRNY